MRFHFSIKFCPISEDFEFGVEKEYGSVSAKLFLDKEFIEWYVKDMIVIKWIF